MATSTTRAAAPTQPPSSQTGAIAIAMFCVLLVSYVLMAADRYLFPVLAADVRKAFGFSLANTGLLSTIFTLGLGIGGPPNPLLFSRYSRKKGPVTGVYFFFTAVAGEKKNCLQRINICRSKSEKKK